MANEEDNKKLAENISNLYRNTTSTEFEEAIEKIGQNNKELKDKLQGLISVKGLERHRAVDAFAAPDKPKPGFFASFASWMGKVFTRKNSAAELEAKTGIALIINNLQKEINSNTRDRSNTIEQEKQKVNALEAKVPGVERKPSVAEVSNPAPEVPKAPPAPPAPAAPPAPPAPPPPRVPVPPPAPAAPPPPAPPAPPAPPPPGVPVHPPAPAAPVKGQANADLMEAIRKAGQGRDGQVVEGTGKAVEGAPQANTPPKIEVPKAPPAPAAPPAPPPPAPEVQVFSKPPVSEGRNKLLEDIQRGVKLKEVEKPEKDDLKAALKAGLKVVKGEEYVTEDLNNEFGGVDSDNKKASASQQLNEPKKVAVPVDLETELKKFMPKIYTREPVKQVEDDGFDDVPTPVAKIAGKPSEKSSVVVQSQEDRDKAKEALKQMLGARAGNVPENVNSPVQRPSQTPGKTAPSGKGGVGV